MGKAVKRGKSDVAKAERLVREREATGIVAVARLAGVATSTVSRVLAGGERAAAFSQTTRRRVEKAARQLHYVPNSHARRLVRGRADHVALVTRSPALPFFGEMVDQFVKVFGEFHIRVSVDVAEPREEEVAAAVRNFGGDMVDAIFVCPGDSSMWVEAGTGMGCPVVSLIHRPLDSRIPHVSFDIRSAAKIATAHLAGLGYRRIGYVGPSQGKDERMDGYLEAMNEAGLTVDRSFVFTDNYFQIDRAHEVGEKLLAMGQHPEALFVASDLNAIGVIHGLVQAGFSVPEDVAITSHDGIRLGAYYRPALTTMAVPWRTMVERCVEMLQAIHAGADARNLLGLSAVLESSLVVRESCGRNARPTTLRPSATCSSKPSFQNDTSKHS